MTDSHYRIEELLEHSDWVRRLAYAIAGNPHDADDLHQDAMQVALLKPPRRQGSLRGWFRTVVRRRWLEVLRSESARQARERTTARGEEQASDVEEILRLEASRQVIDDVQSLDEPYRTVLVKIYFGGKKAAEVARELGRPADTVRSQHSRGIALLRKRWQARHRGRAAYTAALLPLLRWGGPPSAAEFEGLAFPSGPYFLGDVALVAATATLAAALGFVALQPMFADDAAPIDPTEAASVEPRNRRRGDAVPDEARQPRVEPPPPELEPDRARNEIGIALDAPAGTDLALARVSVFGRTPDGRRKALPLAGVRVEDGRLRLSLEALRAAAPRAEEVEVRVEHPQCVDATLFAPLVWRRDLPEDADWLADIRLEKALPLNGSVVDERGRPLSGVRVEAFESTDAWVPPGLAGGTTDAEGRFALRTPARDRYLVVAFPEDRAVAAKTVDGNECGNLECRTGHSLRGRVVDARDLPMAGVPVTARLKGALGWQLMKGTDVFQHEGRVWRGERTTSTDAEGRFTLIGLSDAQPPNGHYELRIGLPYGRLTRRAAVDPAAAVDIGSVMGGVWVDLAFTRSGAAPPEDHVRIDGGEDLVYFGVTNALGRVRAILPLDEPLTVRFGKRVQESFDLLVPSAQRDDPFFFELAANPVAEAALEVRLVADDGTSIPSAGFELRKAGALAWDDSVDRSRRFTGTDGTFVLPGVPAGDWILEAYPGGRLSITSFRTPVSTTVTVPESGRGSATLPTSSLGGRVRIEARVPSGAYVPVAVNCRVLRGGSPIPCGFVQQHGHVPNASIQPHGPATTDRALAPGTYELEIRHNPLGNARVAVPVRAGETTVAELVLRP